MHFRTHVKPESLGQSGRWMGEYADAMIDHDKNVGTVLKALDDAGIADNTFVMYSTDNGPHMNSWPDARHDARSATRRTRTGKAPIACPPWFDGRATSNPAVCPTRSSPTTTGCRPFSAIAGDTEVKDKLLKGYKVGDMTYKVHLDGYNLVPYLTGQAAKSPRESFIYINDDQQVTGLRYDNWKIVFMEQRAEGNDARFGPSRS